LSPIEGEGRTGPDIRSPAVRLRPSPDAVSNRVGDQIVLVHMKTDRIHELNRTGSRLWELLCEGHDRAEIQRRMLQEFDVTEEQLSSEIERILASLRDERLIEPLDEN
jgi:hypothetical protein